MEKLLSIKARYNFKHIVYSDTIRVKFSNGFAFLQLSRPCLEALGVDVFATARKLGYPIEVLTDYKQEMNRYSFLMIE